MYLPRFQLCAIILACFLNVDVWKCSHCSFVLCKHGKFHIQFHFHMPAAVPLFCGVCLFFLSIASDDMATLYTVLMFPNLLEQGRKLKLLKG